jgi:hypothetical protein
MKPKKQACRLCEEKCYALDEQNVYGELHSGPDGLADPEAARRLTYCANDQIMR